MHILSEKQYGKQTLTFHEAATSLRIEKVSQSINLGEKLLVFISCEILNHVFKGKYNGETYFSKFLHYNWQHPSITGAKKEEKIMLPLGT